MILKKVPIRKCLACGTHKTKSEFLMIIRPPKNDNITELKIKNGTYKKEGRGYYICKCYECIKKAKKYRRLERLFSKIKHKNCSEMYNILETAVTKMNDQLLSFLGIVMKSGNLVFGMDSVKNECAKNKVKLILVTSDISQNSLEKILQVKNENPNIKFEKMQYSKDKIESIINKRCAVLGILDSNMAEKTLTLLENKFNHVLDLNSKKFGRNDANDKI